MDSLKLILSIVLPAGGVLVAMYLTVRAFLTKEFERKLIDIKIKNKELILPARLQAYERVTMLLERISPSNLVIRVNAPNMAAADLQQALLAAIREEFTHNLSQQVYISDQAWEMTKNAMQEINTVINHAASQVPGDAKSLELARVIFEIMSGLESDPVVRSLTFVKNEIRQLF